MTADRVLTTELLKEIFLEFDWVEPFTVEDDFPDPIILSFPKCTLLFLEDTYSNHEINLRFDYRQTKTENNLTLFDALHYVFIPEAKNDKNFKEPILHTYVGNNKVDNVKVSVRNICILLKTYLSECIKGDFNWVEKYKLSITSRSPEC